MNSSMNHSSAQAPGLQAQALRLAEAFLQEGMTPDE